MFFEKRPTVDFSFLDLFICVFEKQNGTLNGHKGQTKARSKQLLLGLQCGYRGPNTWAIFSAFSGILTRS